MYEKHIWICSFMVTGAARHCNMGEVDANYSDEVERCSNRARATNRSGRFWCDRCRRGKLPSRVYVETSAMSQYFVDTHLRHPCVEVALAVKGCRKSEYSASARGGFHDVCALHAAALGRNTILQQTTSVDGREYHPRRLSQMEPIFSRALFIRVFRFL